MKKSTIESLAMFRSVIALLKANSQLLETMPGFSIHKEALLTKMEELDAALLAQETATVGIHAVKKEFLDDLRRRVFEMKRALYVHGKATGNIPLMLGNRESENAIRYVKPALLYVMAREVEQQVDQLATNLEGYGITEDKVLEFKIQVDSFVEQLNNTRTAVAKRSIATSRIMIAELDIKRILREDMDVFVSFLEATHPALVQEYRKVRKVQRSRGKRIDRDPEV